MPRKLQAAQGQRFGQALVPEQLDIPTRYVGIRRDMAEALAFANYGKVKTDVEPQPLSAIDSRVERLVHGAVRSHRVLVRSQR